MSATGVRRALLAGTAALATFAATGTAQAQTASGTAAGTVITNTASASYTVNGVAQTKASNAVTFVVDRKVNLTVVPEQQGNTSVVVAQTGAVLAYRLTNSTNGTQDFQLSTLQTILINGDNFDVSNVKTFVDSDGNGIYDPTKDTLTFVNELGADQSVVVFVVADIPNNQAAQLANVTLIARVAAGGDPSTAAAGALLTASLVNDDNQVDVVFADSDGVRDGAAGATLAYQISTSNVALTVVKSSTLISDPINGSLSPKALPGAVVQYCMVVNNSTLGTPASAVVLTDTIPANTNYVPGSITVGSLALLGTCILGTPMNDSGAVVPGSTYTASYNAGTRLVTANIPTIVGGTAVAVTFNVTVN